MGKHIPPLRKRQGNIIFSEDGGVWCNYLLTGLNINAYRPSQAYAAQESHELLYNMLADLPSDDIALTGFRTRTDPVSIIERITGAIPDSGWDRTKYKHLNNLLNEFYLRMMSGEFVAFDRVYWLAINHESGKVSDQLVASMIETDPHEGLDLTKLRDFETACFRAIPPEFRPKRTTPELVDWAFDRATTRGLSVPILPTITSVPAGAAPGEKSYPEVMIDEAADSAAVYSTFLQDVNTGRRYTKELAKYDARRSIFKRFRSLKGGRIMAISHPNRRTAESPDGTVSYQSCLGIARYPGRYTDQVSSFTYLVDQAIRVDADFTLRFQFSQKSVDTKTISETEKDLVAEGTANAEDEFEAYDYDRRRQTLRSFHQAVREENGAKGLDVAAIFAFGSDNLDNLTQRMSAIQQQFRNNGFVPLLPVGGQKELWTMMMPGSRRTSLGDDLLQRSTAHWFSGAIPIRRSFAGDSRGIPIGINKDNANGQIVLLDLLNATDRGNASIAITGAQGGGKSHLMKLILQFVAALNRYAVIVDHSPHGEWAVYARQLANTQVVNAAYGTTSAGREVSMDPLKCLPADQAQIVMMAHYLPLFELEPKSPEAAYFAKTLHPDFRRPRGITSTRKLIEHLRNAGEPEAKVLLLNFNHWASLSVTRAFIDPEPRNSEDRGLPPFDDLSDLAARMESGLVPYATVFRTQDLPVYRGSDPRSATEQNKWAARVYGTIARYTAYRFSMIRGVCVSFQDEISFLKGNEDVVEKIIRSPDRTGRKDGNLIIAASQHADDFDDNYTMIAKRAALRQETEDNARAALRYLDMPMLDSLVDQMLYQTSPKDPDNDNLTRAGRYGEGWWNDGTGNTVRIQYLPILSSTAARFADTTSSRMIREADLTAATAGEVRLGKEAS